MKALTEEGHQGQAYALTGPEALDRQEVAQAISEATGKQVRYEPLSEEAFRERMSGVGMPKPYLELMAGLYQSVRAGDTAHTNGHRRTAAEPPSYLFQAFCAGSQGGLARLKLCARRARLAHNTVKNPSAEPP